MAKPEQIDEVRIKRPDGKYRESIFISANEILLAQHPITAVFTRLIQHANQIGLLGRVVLAWEATDDTMQPGGKKVVLLTQDYEDWAREADAQD
jgi:hypothetical protein